MEIERRGKYPGVKVHLNPEEIEAVKALSVILATKSAWEPGNTLLTKSGRKLVIKIAEKIAEELAADPLLLAPRNEEDIRTVLIKERDSAIAKLAKMDQGVAWNLGKEKS